MCRRVKAKHLKKRADALFAEGNWGKASVTYGEAIEACPRRDIDVLKSLYSNMSLSCSKCNRYEEAKAHADMAIEVSSGRWSKAFWRRGQAFLGMHRLDDAVDDFAMAWNIEKNNECSSKLRAVVRSMPKEMLAGKMMQLVEEVLNDAPVVERIEDVVLREGAYILVKDVEKRGEHFLQGRSCYDAYVDWKMGCGPHKAEAFIFRSRVYTCSKGYLQAREDAEASLHVLLSDLKAQNGEKQLVLTDMVMAAYKALGKGLIAESDHPDRDAVGALKAFTKALHCGSRDQDVYDALQEATELLSKEQVDEAMKDVFREGNIVDAAVGSKSLVYSKVNVSIFFPEATSKSINPYTREKLRSWMSCVGGTTVNKVALEKVSYTGPCGVTVVLQVEVPCASPDVEAMKQRLLSNWSDGEKLQCETKMVDDDDIDTLRSYLGELDRKCLEISCENLQDSGTETQDQRIPSEKRLIQSIAPKKDLIVPYKEYKLVDAFGNAVARTEKHAFCMSRVYYDRAEIQNETWVELGDGSCRWRQSGSEIKIIALNVPKSLPAKQIVVTFEPYKISVENKDTGHLYLSGTLHRGIVPDECFWTHMGGEGEDACLLTLTKMNLEVLKSHWKHSEMWWSKLFEDHPEIAWDDYEKDYSDLPEEVLKRHRIKEAQREEVKQIESKDEKRRKRLMAAEDLRKKTRMQELQGLRDGVTVSY